jgi:hypothetical protein
VISARVDHAKSSSDACKDGSKINETNDLLAAVTRTLEVVTVPADAEQAQPGQQSPMRPMTLPGADLDVTLMKSDQGILLGTITTPGQGRGRRYLGAARALQGAGTTADSSHALKHNRVAEVQG